MATSFADAFFGSLCCSVVCALPIAIVAAVITYFLLKKKEGSGKYILLAGVFFGILLLCGGCSFIGLLLSDSSYY